MPLISLKSGNSFELNGNTTILDAGARAGLGLPYSCKTGRCSTCKCRVVSGETRALLPELGLSDVEKGKGWILSCVRTAESDVVLEAADLGGITLPTPKTWPCRITQIDFMASNVVRVFLRLPPTADFKFIPGQYVELIGPNGIRRSYSLANGSFDQKKILEIHIRAVECGVMSKYWFSEARVNDLLRLHGPLGTFFLRNCEETDLVFLATGTGIAPVKAILESMAHMPIEKMPRSVAVLWGGRSAADFYIDVAAIAGRHTFHPVRSRPEADWTGAKGYVQHTLIDLKPDWRQLSVYACGSFAMIRDAQNILVAAGLPAERFYSDAFVCSSPSVTE